VIRWLGGEAEAQRARRSRGWSREGKISIVLLYLLAIAGMVIVFLTVMMACRPAEPPNNRAPTNLPSQHYIAELPETDRCGDRPPLDEFSSEDPRFIP
jgi:hypothetical protein